jgi:uronate dehydrogenase
LVTGAFGWTAQAIIETLHEAGHEIVAFDLPTASPHSQVTQHFSNVIRGDISHYDDIFGASEHIDAIIHLAVAVGQGDYDTADRPFAVNVKGTYHIFEASRQHNISKIVMMSSAPIHIPHQSGEKIHAVHTYKSSPDGDHLYDLTKRLQEDIAKDFCATFDMNCVVLRAGHIVDGRAEVDPKGRPLSQVHYCRGGWVCRYDLAAACLKALEIDRTGYNAFHVIGGRKAQTYFDIERTEHELGLTCKTHFEAYP